MDGSLAIGDELLTEDFKHAPYWWEAAKPMPVAAPPLRPSYDVAIVGSGYTGLRAALTLLRGGRSVVVFDSEDPGFGASRRNAGFLGRVLKKSFLTLQEKQGLEHAIAVYRELDAAYQTTIGFIEAEAIDCHAVRCGRFVGATSPAHYEEMAREYAAMRLHLGLDYHMLTKASQHQEIATDIYYGGAVIPDLGSLHPGLYHKGLLDRVLAAGGVVVGRSAVTGIEPSSTPQRFKLRTPTREVMARDVVIATNGYTPRHFAWHSRRVIPFTGYIAATEPLAPELLRKVLPNRRTVINSNLNVDSFRPAPDTPRLVFCGATGNGLSDVREIARRLHGNIARVLPDLASARLSHVWTGQCAGTFDMMPHIGQHEGIYHAMGYNFAGVPMGSYLGHKVGQQILGLPEGRTVFEKAEFRTMPLYSGNPWFVPIAMRYFDWRDARAAHASP
jgi:glycine/D-amino acid oxidase-like deaminating enzyme